MKKYVILLLSTGLVVALLVGVHAWTAKTPPTVKLTAVDEQILYETVDCTGKVELSDSEEVYVDLPCVAGEVFVSAGQAVSKGDPLFTIDMNATQAVLAQLGTSLSGSSLKDDQTVTAPTSGIITEISVRQGNTLDHTTPCAVIAPGENLQIAAVIREKYIQQVQVGQQVEISGVGFSKDVYHGTVTAIATTAHQQYIGSTSETVVDAVVCFNPQETDSSLRVGLNANASIVVGTVENALLIPYNCIGQDEEGREYVYVYHDDGTARRRTITVAREYADGALVVSGISAGERLVQDPDALQGDCVTVCEEG